MEPSPRSGISFIVRDAQISKNPIHPHEKEVPVTSFRTTSIFHYTKDIISLKRILEDGIIPNFCSEELAKDVIIGIPMVSFCDIPLGKTHKQAKDYGAFAIGLATEYGEKNGVNPVFYVSNPQTMDMVLGRDQHGKVKIDQFVSSPISGLYKRCYGEFDNKAISNYAENEWRYVVAQSDCIHWHQSLEEYKEWRKSGIDGKKPNHINNPNLYNNRLKFNASDINYFIVEKEEYVPQLVSYIYNLNTVGGTEYFLSDRDKLYLVSRIRSIEGIRRDY